MRFGEEAEGAGVDAVGGERGISGLGVALPFLCAEGGLGLFGEEELESFWDSDCERERNASSDAFFLLS
jgi:hypothetical protein